jgi:hypothetical protein
METQESLKDVTDIQQNNVRMTASNGETIIITLFHNTFKSVYTACELQYCVNSDDFINVHYRFMDTDGSLYIGVCDKINVKKSPGSVKGENEANQ